MSPSVRDARRPPQAITAAGTSSTRDVDHRMAMRLIGLAVVRDVLRSRRFQERVILAVIVAKALRQVNQQGRASTMARLAAWDKRQIHSLEAKAEKQSRAVKGTRQMASRPSKDLPQKMREA